MSQVKKGLQFKSYVKSLLSSPAEPAWPDIPVYVTSGAAKAPADSHKYKPEDRWASCMHSTPAMRGLL